MSAKLGLFEAIGIEIEYMIVDRETLDVRPFADRVLAAANGGEIVSEIERGRIAWSNELVAHVIELKTAGPAEAIDLALLGAFEADVRQIDELLRPHGARLLPTAMHPWMDPLRETVLWPHEYSPVYEAYDRIFSCQGHGWSNLQSLHLNYPFDGDDEFGRLHAAIRLLLPILPALAASSPVVEGRLTAHLDSRLEHYRTNSRRIPSIAGDVIPEPVSTEASYREQIFERMYRDIAPHDPEGILRDEFLNARGAIARFDRGAIEIRVIDVQECPRADLAIAAGVTAALRWLVSRHESASSSQPSAADFPTAPLAALLRRTSMDGADTEIADIAYLGLFGLAEPATAGALWRHLLDETQARGWLDEPWAGTLDEMLRLGPVAARLRRQLGEQPSRDTLHRVYRQLADGLHAGELLRA